MAETSVWISMGDAIFLGIGLGAFALFALYVFACGRA